MNYIYLIIKTNSGRICSDSKVIEAYAFKRDALDRKINLNGASRGWCSYSVKRLPLKEEYDSF